MLTRLSGLAAAALAGFALLYISRFWIFDLWSADGLFGISYLRPQGKLWLSWLWGTPLTPFDMLIWSVVVFLLLTAAENLRKYF